MNKKRAALTLAILAASAAAAIFKPPSSPQSPSPGGQTSPLARHTAPQGCDSALDHQTYFPFAAKTDLTIDNASFEGIQWSANRFWFDPWHTAYSERFNEVRPPIRWVAWWVENRFCPHNEPYKSGRPEFTVITDAEDQNRVSLGTQAAKAFTFYRCGLFGLYQQAELPPGAYYFGAKMHAWYTSCSHDLYGGRPRDAECKLLTNEHMYLSIGVDTTGGQDYWSQNIHWLTYERYGTYITHFWSVPFILNQPATVTLWIKAESWAPLKHNDLYVDDVILLVEDCSQISCVWKRKP